MNRTVLAKALRPSVALILLFIPISSQGIEGLENPSTIKPSQLLKKTATPSLPALLAAAESHYSSAKTLSAKFMEERSSSLLSNKKLLSGLLLWRYPNSIRWETTSPDPSLLVSNGEKIWLYTPPFDEDENGQVLITKASTSITPVTDALLTAQFSVAIKKGVTIQKLTPRQFLLKPRKGSAGDLKEARMSFLEDKPIVFKITLIYETGNRSTFTLSQIEMGNPIEDHVFRFKVPPKTDIVQK